MSAANALPVAEESLVKFSGDHKKMVDRAFVIWCCKSSRPLSMGETDKAFRKFCLVATSGKYKPPCKKTAREELVTCVAASRIHVKGELKVLMEEDGLDPCLSGIVMLPQYFRCSAIACLPACDCLLMLSDCLPMALLF